MSFRSWNGVARRSDNDAELVFLRGGRVWMLDYGYTLTVFDGSYRIDAERLSVRFQGVRADWPEMAVAHDGTTLVLDPAPGSVSLPSGRGTEPIHGGANSFWRFRVLDCNEQARVLETLRDLNRRNR